MWFLRANRSALQDGGSLSWPAISKHTVEKHYLVLSSSSTISENNYCLLAYTAMKIFTFKVP